MRLRAAKPAHHSSRASALDPGQRSSRAGVLQVLSPRALELVLHNQRTQSNEQPTHHSKEEAPLTTLRGESAHSHEDSMRPKISEEMKMFRKEYK